MLKQIIITALKSKIGKQILSYLLMEFVEWIRKELGLTIVHESTLRSANINAPDSKTISTKQAIEIFTEHSLNDSLNKYE